MKTVDKAMSLLRQFSIEHVEIGLNDLARATGQDKAVTRRLLLSLAKHDYIEQNPENRRYRLGHGFLALARVREMMFPMIKATQIVCSWLAVNANETAHVGIPGRNGMSTASFKLPPRGNVINLRPAETYPFHSSSSGLAYLSYCSPETLNRILDYKREKLTRFTVTDQDQLLDLIAEFRQQGYAYSRNTVEIGVASVAKPFFIDRKEPAGTVAITVPDLNMDDARKVELAELLNVAVNMLETAITGGPVCSTLQ